MSARQLTGHVLRFLAPNAPGPYRLSLRTDYPPRGAGNETGGWPEPTWPCPECPAQNLQSDGFCQACGRPRPDTEEPPEAEIIGEEGPHAILGPGSAWAAPYTGPADASTSGPPAPRVGGPWVVVTSDLTAAWVIDGPEDLARAFASFVSREIDPAVALPARDPVGELVTWRASAGMEDPEGARS